MTSSSRQFLHSVFWTAYVLTVFVCGAVTARHLAPQGCGEVQPLTDDGRCLDLPAAMPEQTRPAVLYAPDQNERGQWFNPVHPLTKEPAVTVTRMFTTARGDRYEGRTFHIYTP